jgi:biopolymer transport protein TolR
MPRLRDRKRPISEINVVPYIDVMLVLLVIFMITAPLLTQGVKVDLPKTDAQVVDTTTSDPLVVSVTAEGDYYLNYGEDQDSPVTTDDLVNRVSALLRHRPNMRVLVKGDRSESVGLITDPPENPRQ